MNAKEKFFRHAYNKLKTAIINIPDSKKEDIYALSFWYFTEDDDPRFPMITFSYNTISNVQSQIEKASNEAEAKWNYAFWLQNDLMVVGGEEDEFLAQWFEDSPYYYSDEEIDEADDDDDLFDELLELSEDFNYEFIEGVIDVTQKLFRENIIKKAFGKDIPVLIHELEYYDDPINWTIRANPEGLVDEFVQTFKFD